MSVPFIAPASLTYPISPPIVSDELAQTFADAVKAQDVRVMRISIVKGMCLHIRHIAFHPLPTQLCFYSIRDPHRQWLYPCLRHLGRRHVQHLFPPGLSIPPFFILTNCVWFMTQTLTPSKTISNLQLRLLSSTASTPSPPPRANTSGSSFPTCPTSPRCATRCCTRQLAPR